MQYAPGARTDGSGGPVERGRGHRDDEEVIGTLGVIGPTRMAYERVIPIVDVTAKLLSNALTLQVNER